MRLSMKARRAVTKGLAMQYQRGSKKEKSAILDRFVEATGYNRAYAAGLLRNHGKRLETAPGVVLEASVRAKKPSAPRKRRYGARELKALKKVWNIMDYICGKRLAPAPEDVRRVSKLPAATEIVSGTSRKFAVTSTPVLTFVSVRGFSVTPSLQSTKMNPRSGTASTGVPSPLGSTV